MGAVHTAIPGGVLHDTEHHLAHVQSRRRRGRDLARQERHGTGQLRRGQAREDHSPDRASHSHLSQHEVRVHTNVQADQPQESAAVRPQTRQLSLSHLFACQVHLSC